MHWKIAAHLSLSPKQKSAPVPTHTTRSVSQSYFCASPPVLCIIFKNTATFIEKYISLRTLICSFLLITEPEHFTHFLLLFILLLMTYKMPSIF